MAVITIARQFGCGGSEIGRAVAEALGARYLDRALLSEAANRIGVPEDIVSERDERIRGITEQLLSDFAIAFSGRQSERPRAARSNLPPTDAQLLAVTRSIVREVAGGGNAVIVGRGAQMILRNEPSVLHVHLVAPLATRIAYVVERYGLGQDEARRLISTEDANRIAYMRTYYNVDRDDPTLYDMVLNTGRLSQEGAVQLIVLRAAMVAGDKALPAVQAHDEDAQRLLTSLQAMRESVHAIVGRYARRP
jgi:cytidylate kinase